MSRYLRRSSAEFLSTPAKRAATPPHALAIAASSVPCFWRIDAAVFSPMPLAPGMPSDGSPRSAMKSGTCSGSTP